MCNRRCTLHRFNAVLLEPGHCRSSATFQNQPDHVRARELSLAEELGAAAAPFCPAPCLDAASVGGRPRSCWRRWSLSGVWCYGEEMVPVHEKKTKKKPPTQNLLLEQVMLHNGSVCRGGLSHFSGWGWKPSSGLGGRRFLGVRGTLGGWWWCRSCGSVRLDLSSGWSWPGRVVGRRRRRRWWSGEARLDGGWRAARRACAWGAASEAEGQAQPQGRHLPCVLLHSLSPLFYLASYSLGRCY